MPAVINANDKNLLAINGKSNHGPLAIVGYSQTWAYIVALISSQGKRSQLFAIGHDGVGVAFGNFRRGRRGYKSLERHQLLHGFRRILTGCPQCSRFAFYTLLCAGLLSSGAFMTPTFRIVADGADITSLINDHLLLLRTTDKPGMESGDFELRIDDRDSAVSLPNRGSSIEIFLMLDQPELFASAVTKFLNP